MGQKADPNAKKRAHPPVMPTAEEIVAEVRQAQTQRMATMVKVNDLEDALGVVRGSGRRTCRKMGIEPALRMADGTIYITQEDARRVAERMV